MLRSKFAGLVVSPQCPTGKKTSESNTTVNTKSKRPSRLQVETEISGVKGTSSKNTVHYSSDPVVSLAASKSRLLTPAEKELIARGMQRFGAGKR